MRDTDAAIPTTTVRRAESTDDIASCLSIRSDVFVREQGVPPELEIDGFDAVAAHYLGFRDRAPLATGRVRLVGELAKLQRIAVLPRARGTGLGAALVRRMIEDLRAEGVARGITLGSQEAAVGFYGKLGFAVHGERFMDAGIAHREMRLALR